LYTKYTKHKQEKTKVCATCVTHTNDSKLTVSCKWARFTSSTLYPQLTIAITHCWESYG